MSFLEALNDIIFNEQRIQQSVASPSIPAPSFIFPLLPLSRPLRQWKAIHKKLLASDPPNSVAMMTLGEQWQKAMLLVKDLATAPQPPNKDKEKRSWKQIRQKWESIGPPVIKFRGSFPGIAI